MNHDDPRGMDPMAGGDYCILPDGSRGVLDKSGKCVSLTLPDIPVTSQPDPPTDIVTIDPGHQWFMGVFEGSAYSAKGGRKPWQEADPIPTFVPPTPALKNCPAVATFTTQTIKSIDPLVQVTATWQVQRQGTIRNFFKMKIPGVPRIPGLATGFYRGTYVDPIHPPVPAEGVVVCDAGAGFFW